MEPMGESENRLFVAGVLSGFLVGVLGALLVRERRAATPEPLPEGGIVLRRVVTPADAPGQVRAAGEAPHPPAL